MCMLANISKYKLSYAIEIFNESGATISITGLRMHW
jgi:hypothetical protein